MLKFLLIVFLAWFVINRLLRFKVIIFKNGQPNGDFHNSYSTSQRKEGTLRVDKEPSRSPKNGKNPKEGDYVDYEEV